MRPPYRNVALPLLRGRTSVGAHRECVGALRTTSLYDGENDIHFPHFPGVLLGSKGAHPAKRGFSHHIAFMAVWRSALTTSNVTLPIRLVSGRNVSQRPIVRNAIHGDGNIDSS